MNDETQDDGIDPETIERIITNPGQSILDLEQATHGAGRVALLNYMSQLLESESVAPRLQGYPPTFFISYKWESDDHRRWAQQFADGLTDLGYDVLLDRYACHVEKLADVPKYITSMVRSQYVIMIGTPAYTVSGTWVFDEINLALSLKNARRSIIIPVVKEDRDGDVSLWFSTRTGANEQEILDFTSVDDPREAVKQRFKPYRGLVLSSAESEQLAEAVSTIGRKFDEGDFRTAARMLEEVPPQFHTCVEIRALAARLYAIFGQKQTATSLARDVLRVPDLSEELRLSCIHTMYRAGANILAMGEIGKLLPFPAHDDVNLHYLAGNILDELDDPRAGIRHLRYALHLAPDAPMILSDLGTMLASLDLDADAEECFRKALALAPHHVLAAANLVLLLESRERAAEAEQLRQEMAAHVDNFSAYVESAARDIRERCVPDRMAERNPRMCGDAVLCVACDTRFELCRPDDKLCATCGVVKSARGQICSCMQKTFIIPQQSTTLQAARCPFCRRRKLSHVTAS